MLHTCDSHEMLNLDTATRRVRESRRERVYEGAAYEAGTSVVCGGDRCAFASTMKEDPTDFDDTKVPLIVQGKTTTAEVIAMLGRPGGRAIYPVADGENERALVYLYHQVKRAGGFQLATFEKSLDITYGKDDVVTKVEFSQSGKR